MSAHDPDLAPARVGRGEFLEAYAAWIERVEAKLAAAKHKPGRILGGDGARDLTRFFAPVTKEVETLMDLCDLAVVEDAVGVELQDLYREGEDGEAQAGDVDRLMGADSGPWKEAGPRD